MKPPGRIILVIAILGLLGMMGGGVYYASLDNPKLEQAVVELSTVELRDVNTIENNLLLCYGIRTGTSFLDSYY